MSRNKFHVRVDRYRVEFTLADNVVCAQVHKRYWLLFGMWLYVEDSTISIPRKRFTEDDILWMAQEAIHRIARNGWNDDTRKRWHRRRIG